MPSVSLTVQLNRAFMDIFITLGGLALLIAGGEGIVRGAVGIAGRAGLSPFIIGLTIVGFGTSAPELVVSVDSVLSNAPGIAVGNVIGSNMANMMLVIGLVALIKPPSIEGAALIRDGAMLALATLAFVGAGYLGIIAESVGILMLAMIVTYLGVSIWLDARKTSPAAELHRHEAEELSPSSGTPLLLMIVMATGGLAGLVIGSNLTVQGATAIAREFGVGDEVIGISIIAVGTSLPELATSVVAALRRHADVCLGNVIGSNIFNLLGITGVAALFTPLPLSSALIAYDLPILLGTTALFIFFLVTNRRFQRWEGVVMLSLYCAYIYLHFGS